MSKKSTAEFFDSYAHGFNAIYGNKNTFLNNLINKYFRESMKLRYDKTIEGCYPIKGKTVIDIGCGPGHYSITLAKKGADYISGIDFAEAMIDLARQNAKNTGVENKCNFILGDFMNTVIKDKFDYSIVMGFMDYIEEPWKVIEKVLSITKAKAFFSFPVEGGVLAWQRKLRYKKKCNLFMYNIEQLHELFANLNYKKLEVEKISRDLFVTVYMENGNTGSAI
ncbi:MAG: methyltransferase domain-containing protein [Candidatus Omnitrophica bacterium]|nr:methyltransferase domain-containing protein [Candidatus Omnitrophota bacterium]MBU4478278.1 methyltransferase domain-containing protein [Candidatus Omnitrophota bacterium]MCG2703346.1 methyltransferase domain-containing protein [Candidatus Omnitrophota bacterium]